jgi:hypothetical protein
VWRAVSAAGWNAGAESSALSAPGQRALHVQRRLIISTWMYKVPHHRTLSPTTSRASSIVPTCRLHGNSMVGEQNPPDVAMLLHVLLAHDLFGPIYPCITGSNLFTRAVDATSTSIPTPSQESPHQSVPDVKRSTRAPEHKQGTPRREKGSATQTNDVAQLSPCLSRSMAVAVRAVPCMHWRILRLRAQ